MNEILLLPQAKRQIIERHFGVSAARLVAHEPEFGHMAYWRHSISAPDGQRAFVKLVLPDKYVDDELAPAEKYMASDLRHLRNEAKALTHLNEVSPELVPQIYQFDDGEGVLIVEHLPHAFVAPENTDDLEYYWNDAAGALSALQRSEPISNINRTTLDWLANNSWDGIDFELLPDDIQDQIRSIHKLGVAAVKRICDLGDDELFPTHHDAQQNNIGWDRELGAKIIDPSWYSLGPRSADTTMLLMDLAATNHDVDQLKTDDNFNNDYALVRAGNLLRRSLISPVEAAKNASGRSRQRNSALSTLRLLDLLK